MLTIFDSSHMSDTVIKVEGLSKRFIISHEKRERYTSLGDVLTRRVKELFNNNASTQRETHEEFWALKDVEFEVKRGDRLGIIGRNGAGKSTLLKILSRITEPTKGRISIEGRVASLLEVGTGFHPELTGSENIFLNGAVLGMSRAEIKIKFDEIVAFAEVERFLDTPVKRYSSGMYVRLAFAVAAHLEPEILIVDEVLAVGDAQFQKKCLGKMEDVSKNEGRTVLFVSHDLNAISSLTKKVVVLKNGSVSMFDETIKSIAHYQADFRKPEAFIALAEKLSKPIYIKNVRVCNADEQDQTSFLYTESVAFEFIIEINDERIKCDLFVMVLDAKKRTVFALESNQISKKMKIILDPSYLVRGNYSISVLINQPKIGPVDEVEDVCSFEIIDNGSQMLKHGDYDYGSVFGKGKWMLS